MSKNERIKFLEALNKHSRGREEKNTIIIVDVDTGEELVKLGVFGIEV